MQLEWSWSGVVWSGDGDRHRAGDRCQGVLDAQGLHAATCLVGGRRKRTHDNLRDLYGDLLPSAGFAVHREQHVPGWDRQRQRPNGQWAVERAILDLRLSELADVVSESDDRMVASSEDDDIAFRIEVAEPGVAYEGEDRFDALVRDLGLGGERVKQGDRLSRDLLEELASSGRAITLLALADKCGDSRARVQRSVERMRAAGIVERVPMLDRIAQDVYGGLMRQHDARGEEWLMTRGGVGRLDDSVSKALISGVRKKKLNIEKVQEILGPVPLDSQKVLLNTLGGRMPYGFRVAGRDGAAVKERVMRRVDRTLRRMRTVAQRLDEALCERDE